MLLTSEQLWPAVRSQSRRASQSGALVPISASVHVLEEQGLTFAVRRVERIARKEAAGRTGEHPGDPFAPPYEPDLYVGEMSETHVALLNKFNVLDEHLLLVTREYEPQTALLRETDFRAMLRALAGTEGLAFYNGGTEAGASRAHKHLQVVPLPLAESVPRIPFIPYFERASTDGGPVRSAELPFVHAAAAMPAGWPDDPDRAATAVTDLYHQLWHTLGCTPPGGEQPLPYNLLATTNWLWLVPRSREAHEGIAVNALGFAGALLVRDAAMHRRLEEIGALRVLAAVSTESGRL